MKKTIWLTLLLAITRVLAAQQESMLLGLYSDGLTNLILKDSGRFVLTTSYDPVFDYQFGTYKNEGKWEKSDDNTIVLNPQLAKRQVSVKHKEYKNSDPDSILIEIDYKINYFAGEKQIRSEPFDYERVTIFFNKKKHHFNVVKQPVRRICAFQPKIKNQVIVHENRVTLTRPKKGLQRIGFMTYGMERYVEMPVNNPESNHIVLEIIQEIDLERMPRSKTLKMAKNRAYYYEVNGKVCKMLTPLVKDEEPEPR